MGCWILYPRSCFSFETDIPVGSLRTGLGKVRVNKTLVTEGKTTGGRQNNRHLQTNGSQVFRGFHPSFSFVVCGLFQKVDRPNRSGANELRGLRAGVRAPRARQGGGDRWQADAQPCPGTVQGQHRQSLVLLKRWPWWR